MHEKGEEEDEIERERERAMVLEKGLKMKEEEDDKVDSLNGDEDGWVGVRQRWIGTDDDNRVWKGKRGK